MTVTQLSIDRISKLQISGDRIFRLIENNYEKYILKLLDSGLIDYLSDIGSFPKTWVSDYKVEGYNLIIEHEKLDYWNYPYEWPSELVVEAGRFILQTNEIANKYGYELRDPHPYNVIYRRGRPVYVDLGSFSPLNKFHWTGKPIFELTFELQAKLIQLKLFDLAKSTYLRSDYVSLSTLMYFLNPLFRIAPTFLKKIILKIYKLRSSLLSASDSQINERLIGTKLVLANVCLYIHWGLNKYFYRFNPVNKKLPKLDSAWGDYHNTFDDSDRNRFSKIISIIAKLPKVHSILEVGGNQGAFTKELLKLNCDWRIVLTDYDDAALNKASNSLRCMGVDIFTYDIARTDGRPEDVNIEYRFTSDLVVALALTHHLLISQEIPIDFLFNRFYRITKRYLIVEFMPLGLYFDSTKSLPPPLWYTEQWFRAGFANYFECLCDELIAPNRHLFLLRRV